MNYRHAYHAGNFADVLKHLVLALVIDYLKRKDAPFRVIDTHAGPGRYLLDAPQALKTGEWQRGIGRLLGPGARPLPAAVEQAMAPYLDAVRAENAGAHITFYPGSPLIACRLLRPQDRLVANELHPEDGAELKALLSGDRRAKVLALDGWVAVRSLLPPKERRGVMLIDPPFEQEGEFARMVIGLGEALRRFKTGVCICWYPIKDRQAVAAFHEALAGVALAPLLRAELMVRETNDAASLDGCGVIIANPPFTLSERLAAVLPEIKDRLADGPGAQYRIDQLARLEGSPSAPALRKRALGATKARKGER